VRELQIVLIVVAAVPATINPIYTVRSHHGTSDFYPPQTHPEKFTTLRRKAPPCACFNSFASQRRMLVDDVRRLTNRITNVLSKYVPQPLEWFKDRDTLVFATS
jgi:hypothetical protein